MNKNLFFSLLLNAFVTLPFIVLFSLSSNMRFQLYQKTLAPWLGKPDIVFVGDSLTRDGGIWGLRIGKYDFNTWNLGRSGLTTRQIGFNVSRLQAFKPKYIFIMAGINDHDKSKDEA
jgi:lysophospholipase L1-like esterase